MINYDYELCYVKILQFFKKFWKYLCWILFLIYPPQMFFCEYSKFFNNTCFEKQLQTASCEI